MNFSRRKNDSIIDVHEENDTFSYPVQSQMVFFSSKRVPPGLLCHGVSLCVCNPYNLTLGFDCNPNGYPSGFKLHQF